MDLIALRSQINNLDQTLLELLAKRMEVSSQVAKWKLANNLAIFDAARESELLQKLGKLAQSLDLSTDLVEEIYRLILLASKQKQEKLIAKNKTKIGIQGGLGSFNDLAITDFLSKNGDLEAEVVYLYTTQKVLEALNNCTINLAQFAVHNSLGGMVEETLAVLGKYPFEVVNNYSIQISHTLMICKTANLAEIDTVMAHFQVLKQCKNNLAQEFPQLVQIAGSGDLSDNGSIAKALAEGKLGRNVAVLASKKLAEIYNFQVVAENLQDADKNFTTFLLVKNRNLV